MSKTESTADQRAWLPSVVCWVAIALFAASLQLPALRMQGRGQWVGDLGLQCAFLSLAEFPCWVPNALLIAAPFVAMFAGKAARKVLGLVLGITTLTALRVCIPQVAIQDPSRQGLLPGFWLWAAALATATAGLLLGGFSPVRTSAPGPSSPKVSSRSGTRMRGAARLCWLAFAIVVVANFVNVGSFLYRFFPQGLSHAFSVLALEVLIPALLAMAPLACIYAHPRTQRLFALALGFLGLLPFLSIGRPDDQPLVAMAPRLAAQPGDQSLEVLLPLLVWYLSIALAVAGLLVSAGLMKRSRNARAGLAESPSGELLDHEADTPDVSRAVGNPPLGAALCWLALAHYYGLGSLASPVEWMIGGPGYLVTLTGGLLAMAPWVCTFSGPTARRVLGAFLALAVLVSLKALTALMLLKGMPWSDTHRLSYVIASCLSVIALCLSAASLLLADVATRRRAE
jgi:hypothetical protein